MFMDTTGWITSLTSWKNWKSSNPTSNDNQGKLGRDSKPPHPNPMTIAQLINHLNAIEDKNKEIKFCDIATNYKYKVFCIDKKDNEIVIEDTGE